MSEAWWWSSVHWPCLSVSGKSPPAGTWRICSAWMGTWCQICCQGHLHRRRVDHKLSIAGNRGACRQRFVSRRGEFRNKIREHGQVISDTRRFGRKEKTWIPRRLQSRWRRGPIHFQFLSCTAVQWEEECFDLLNQCNSGCILTQRQRLLFILL